MLVIFSDIHLTDESTALNVDPAAFALLAKEIEASAGQRGATEIHVVLLGDVFDLVRTDYWHSTPIDPSKRPWGGTLDPKTAMNQDAATIEHQFNDVLEGILATPSSKGLIQMLKGLPAVAGQKPTVTYVIGNHDRAFNNFDSLKDRVRRALPGVKIEFANSLSRPDYGLLARHGHEWDDNCHGWEFLTDVLDKGTHLGRFDPDVYKVMAIGEAITTELMAGLVYYVGRDLDPKSADDRAFLKNLKDVNNLRPITEALTWVSWFTRGKSDRYIPIVQRALLAALDGLLDSSLAKRWDDLKPDILVSGDITDYLDKARRVLRDEDGLKNLGDLASEVSKVAGVWRSVSGHGLDDLEKGAKEEFIAGMPAGIQYIVYGHTHVALHDCFSADQSGAVHMYINTGTYLPLVERALDGKSFVRSHSMTILFFYNEAEDRTDRADKGPTLDLWNGMRRKAFT